MQLGENHSAQTGSDSAKVKYVNITLVMFTMIALFGKKKEFPGFRCRNPGDSRRGGNYDSLIQLWNLS